MNRPMHFVTFHYINLLATLSKPQIFYKDRLVVALEVTVQDFSPDSLSNGAADDLEMVLLFPHELP